MKFDVHKDLQPVSWISRRAVLSLLRASRQGGQEFLALAKRTRGSLTRRQFLGDPRSSRAEMLNEALGSSPPVASRGGGPAVIALISGTFAYISPRALHPAAPESGRAKAFAVTTRAVSRCRTCRDDLFIRGSRRHWYRCSTRGARRPSSPS